MNYSTAVMLINENIRAIKVTYEIDEEGRSKKTRYIFKTLDKSIKKGDYVVIPTTTRHGMTVVLVDEVDVDVDFESPTLVKWIISKVSNENYEHILEEEQKWIETLKASEKRKKKEELKKNMIDYVENSDLENLSIAKMSSVDAIAIENKEEK